MKRSCLSFLRTLFCNNFVMSKALFFKACNLTIDSTAHRSFVLCAQMTWSPPSYLIWCLNLKFQVQLHRCTVQAVTDISPKEIIAF